MSGAAGPQVCILSDTASQGSSAQLAGSGEEVELDLEEYMNAIASGDEAASDDGGKAADE